MDTLPPPARTARRDARPPDPTGPPPSAANGVCPGETSPAREPGDRLDVELIADLGRRLTTAANSVVAGKPDVVETAVATLFAGGHLLIEDIPGVGKTLLAQVISRSVGGSFRRIQGTSDLLPSDVTGSMVPHAGPASAPEGTSEPVTGGMVFRRGPVFANVVVFDELNRATPRTQSALLELAEEATVTVDGVSHRLPDPFMIVATQNPIDIAGTYGLGEGALDRFAAVVTPGRPSPASELDVLAGRHGRSRLDAVAPVATLDDVRLARRLVATVHLAESLADYVVRLLSATRSHPSIRLGASTRGGVSLIALARARAAIRGREYVIADDITSLAVAALAHRIVPVERAGSTQLGRRLVAECVETVVPPGA